jgi:hypothetical protein
MDYQQTFVSCNDYRVGILKHNFSRQHFSKFALWYLKYT